MADIFDEVDEELRREKLEEFWKQNGNFIVTLIVLIVLTTAVTAAWRSYSFDQNVEKTSELLEAVSKNSITEQGKALGAYVEKTKGVHGALARMYSAGLMASEGNVEKAVELYNQVAADKKIDPLYRDFARLMSLIYRLDSADAVELTRDIDALDKRGNAWRHSAQELRALLAAREGAYEKAAELMAQIAADIDAPASLRSRANALEAAYASMAALETETQSMQEGSVKEAATE